MKNGEDPLISRRTLTAIFIFILIITVGGLVSAVYMKTPRTDQAAVQFNQQIASTNADLNAKTSSTSASGTTTGGSTTTTTSSAANQIVVWGDSMVAGLSTLGNFQNVPTVYEGSNGESSAAVEAAVANAVSTGQSNLTNSNTIIWIGDSSIPGNTDVNDVAIVTKIVKDLNAKPNQKILILPLFDVDLQAKAPGSFDLLKFAFPNYYFDARTALVKESKSWFKKTYPAQYAATWLASCPQQTCTNSAQEKATNSQWDVQHNIPPRALRLDGVHLNPYGNQLLKQILTKELIKRGWIS